MSESVRVLTDENWETEVMRASGPVLVDFWAKWPRRYREMTRVC